MSFIPLAVLALMLGTAAPSARRQPPSCRGVQGHMTRSDGTRSTIVISERDRCLEVQAVGRVTFDDADADVQALEPGGSFVATESRGGEVRALSLAWRGGAIEREYQVNGRVRPAAEGAEWFRGVVLDIVRQSGYGAERRVARIRRQGGASAVLDELQHIRSDYVRQRYLEILIAEDGMTTDEIGRSVRFASDNIGSDYSKGLVLRAAVVRRGEDRAVAEAVTRGAATIGSDYERANVLLAALERAEPDVPATRESFFRALDGVGSDYERGRVLRTLAGRDALGGETVRAILRSAARIGSDHEKAMVLLAVATQPERLRDDASRAAFDLALKSIGSDYEYRRVASIFAR